MQFSNLLYTTILQNLGFIIMVAFGFKTFNIPLKWLILFSLIALLEHKIINASISEGLKIILLPL